MNVEVMVPELQRLPPGNTFRVFYGSDDYWGIDEFDVVKQGLVSHHVENVDGNFQRVSMPFRYVWPAELDLMAARRHDAARTLERMDPRAVTIESRQHVSVWEKPWTARPDASPGGRRA